ncbi:MAG: GTP 3',8-cyclase MoaA [Phycisphaeraceae bacterium]|nr:MAG: GTP 3',8-cyclase MoaA [Phycisphaeraceae bacterium]
MHLPVLPTSRSTPLSHPAGPIHELHDAHGRVIRDLRISITDRCNFRCVYCMEPDVRFKRKIELLTDSEIVRTVRVARSLGVRRVRLTGGEPSIHPTLDALIRDIWAVGLDDLSMTSNGSVLNEGELAQLKDAGLQRLTVSLDSLRTDRFRALTRSAATPARVLETVEAAKRVGLEPVRINAVIVRGFNDDEIADLAALARVYDADVRLIEYMPLDSGRQWEMSKVVPIDEIVDRVHAVFPIEAAGRERTSSPATGFRFADGGPGRFGVIASVTRPFCGACSRLRITADGMVMPCLFSTDEYDLRAVLRDDRSTDGDIAGFLAAATLRKQAGHGIHDEGYRQPDRPMSAIGG